MDQRRTEKAHHPDYSYPGKRKSPCYQGKLQDNRDRSAASCPGPRAGFRSQSRKHERRCPHRLGNLPNPDMVKTGRLANTYSRRFRGIGVTEKEVVTRWYKAAFQRCAAPVTNLLASKTAHAPHKPFTRGQPKYESIC